MANPGARMTGVASLASTLDDITMRWCEDIRMGVGSDVEYAVHVEYGTYKMKSQPYLRPAVEHVKHSLGKMVKNSGANSIEDVAEYAAEQMKQYAQSVVPVDTGTLRASITVYKYENGSLVEATETGFAV